MNKISEIIDGGYCIGCGACAAVAPESIRIGFNRNGQYEASLHNDSLTTEIEKRVSYVCPFSDDGPNEDDIAKLSYSGASGTKRDSRIGSYKSLYVGHVAESDFRDIGTSGGVITWTLAELLSTGKVDAVIHVVPSGQAGKDVLFEFGVSKSVEDVKVGTKSRYYPVEMSSVLQTVMNTPGNYVVVGLPCFIKAVRRLALQDEVFASRVKFTVGLVCGHLKSRAFADYFAWNEGIQPGKLEAIDFRVKQSSGPAGYYGVKVEGGGIQEERLAKKYFGYNWGYNFFRYSACDYCDDVFSETADLCVGDAWLPGYNADSKGNSVVVVRSSELHELFAGAVQDGRLRFSCADADLIAKSQSGGLRDRREGLSYRLYLKERAGESAPHKRVAPNADGISRKRKAIYRVRMRLRECSHKYWLEAVEANSLQLFKRKMRFLMMCNDLLYFKPIALVRRCVRAAVRRIQR
ncbi:MAG: Coenzyme F420 hydrogenase/dehydrogenase, beta subunit C-terminal domain [Paracoccaceae bacterium]